MSTFTGESFAIIITWMNACNTYIHKVVSICMYNSIGIYHVCMYMGRIRLQGYMYILCNRIRYIVIRKREDPGAGFDEPRTRDVTNEVSLLVISHSTIWPCLPHPSPPNYIYTTSRSIWTMQLAEHTNAPSTLYYQHLSPSDIIRLQTNTLLINRISLR